jgi:glycerophosphoryl diester phosphodiesterase
MSLFATPAATTTATAASLPGVEIWPWPRWLAHRGAGKLAPENTLAAFRLGAAQGFRAFECDVKLSADGLPFLLHDATLERTSNAHGTAGALPWAALSRLDAGSWHSRAFAGEPLASLDAVARFCLRNGYALNLEIKPTPGDDERTGRVVAQAVRSLWGAEVAGGRSAWPLLSSFNPAALDASRLAAPELPRALLADTLWTEWLSGADLAPDALARAVAFGESAGAAGTPADLLHADLPHAAGEAELPPGARALSWLAVAQGLGCVACVLNHQRVDAALIRHLHALGLRVLVYTVNAPERAAELLGWGLDGVITDAVDVMTPARG